MKQIIVFLMFFLAIPAAGEIYQWQDSYGTMNFTDDKDKIPTKYSAKVFSFTKGHKWSVDQSDTAARNAFRLEELRAFNEPAPRIEPPKTTVIIEPPRRVKRHRSARQSRVEPPKTTIIQPRQHGRRRHERLGAQ